ncbi:putative membrane protein [Synechococcus sp. ROS8604]|nr:putative membrane protein [Synechococcus sp. ROS8604]
MITRTIRAKIRTINIKTILFFISLMALAFSQAMPVMLSM